MSELEHTVSICVRLSKKCWRVIKQMGCCDDSQNPLCFTHLSLLLSASKWGCLGRNVTEERARKCINETEGNDAASSNQKWRGIKMSNNNLSWNGSQWDYSELYRIMWYYMGHYKIVWDYMKILQWYGYLWDALGLYWSLGLIRRLWDCVQEFWIEWGPWDCAGGCGS